MPPHNIPPDNIPTNNTPPGQTPSVLKKTKTCDSIFFLKSSVLNYPKTCVNSKKKKIKKNSSVLDYPQTCVYKENLKHWNFFFLNY